MNIKIDQDKCLRCGMCTGTAMDVFSFDDEGNIKVNEENITEENKDSIEDAINSCPVGAISKEVEE
jgi:ferredoxin